MNRANKPGRVVSNPEILGGTPVLEGTRVPAETVLAEVRGCSSRFEIFRHYPLIPLDGIEVCTAWERASGRRDRPVRILA